MANRKSFLELSREGQRKRLKKLCVFSQNDSLRNDNVVEVERAGNQPSSVHENSPLDRASTYYDSHDSQGFEEPVENFDVFESDNDSDNEKTLASEPLVSIDVKLRDWQDKFCITGVALSALLIILRDHQCFSFLPSDSRTLLKTPRTVVVKSVDPGQYHHIGISFWLSKIWSMCDKKITNIELMFGIDGLPLFRSGPGELWPILCSVFNVPRLAKVVFPIGLYYGCKKPNNCHDFLSDFVREIRNLTENGIILLDQKISVKLKGIVCDAPAKSFILCIKGHTGYFSCSKCKQEGQYLNNRMTFPQVSNNTLRTHEGFLTQEDPEFHNSYTPLTDIPGINFLSSFPLDYMHLVCLGVMRTMLYIWIFGPPPLKLNHRLISSISSNLLSLQSCVPSEFCRKPRSLDLVKRWKATEFRQFLLYTGPLVLQDVMVHDYKHYFENFMTLHVAMRILLSPKLCHIHLQYAQGLLEHFLKTFKAIYGQQYITHNFHGLLHISDDVKTFGNLDNCSAFRYENFLYPLKKLVRKGEHPLQQVCKRIMEKAESTSRFYQDSSIINNYPSFSKPHECGPILNDSDPSKQYKEVKFEQFKLTISSPNSCCKLTDGSIVVIINIIHSKQTDCMSFICRKFLDCSDFFGQPLCPSSAIGIYNVTNLSPDFERRQFEEIEEKLVLLKKNGSAFVFPLLHSEE